MVFYFEARGGLMLYMGKDKFENEHLIKHGWPEDVWFHVDNLSSAHVYLRLPIGPLRKKFRETGNLDHIAEAVEDCVALVKANSIEGCKKTTVDVVYTEWENLKKTGDMADGQVGFHDSKKVIKVKDVPKHREIVNRLNKTKKEEHPDLAAQRAERDARVAKLRRERAKAQAKKDAQEKARMQAEKEARDYKHLFNEDDMMTNENLGATEDTSAAVDFEEGFM
ncbi:Coiled-coil domain-containing protein 25 [Hondaea fermentalgiana]|uniref:Coiled-coil domain-containing protein 25 n=1 Tax=Hondaea fermentalgiana TaxID=2315210 RepID=A0A2R5GG64_9STRA|nr:Coiled-coil domain-containing protein 25 [Hondaea fermentalgiana]|eukprot:GBG29896.1 Coiled-coil domain-containing protein 25 [Hondaea fermentalgiana]